MILKKLQKLRYNTLKAYRLIILLNTIGKVLEKLVARRISKAAKIHNLLPKEQIGSRLERLTLLVVELLTE